MKGEFVVCDIDVKPPVPVTCTLYSISVTVIEVVSGRSHIKITLLDSVVEVLRLVGYKEKLKFIIHIIFCLPSSLSIITIATAPPLNVTRLLGEVTVTRNDSPGSAVTSSTIVTEIHLDSPIVENCLVCTRELVVKSTFRAVWERNLMKNNFELLHRAH